MNTPYALQNQDLQDSDVDLGCNGSAQPATETSLGGGGNSPVVNAQSGNERLLILADFLEDLPPVRFDFSDWVSAQKGKCGTVCCAIGWCPKVFPEDWTWKSHAEWDEGMLIPVLHDSEPYLSSIDSCAERFFGLAEDEFNSLFLPQDCNGNNSGLPETASASEVAANIRAFVVGRNSDRENPETTTVLAPESEQENPVRGTDKLGGR